MYAFIKYVKDTPFGKTPLNRVDSAAYSAFMYGFNDKLIKQELGLVSTVTKRIFDYAYYKGYIQQNIAYLDDIQSIDRLRTLAEKAFG